MKEETNNENKALFEIGQKILIQCHPKKLIRVANESKLFKLTLYCCDIQYGIERDFEIFVYQGDNLEI